MTNTLETIDPNTELLYNFRFEHSGQNIHLTQKQLNLIPYLSTLLANQKDEYVLKSPVDYTSFAVILRSVTSNQPYILFTELHEDADILNTLNLVNYLNINLFSIPPLQAESSIRSKGFTYQPVKNIFEARNTAAEFIIALRTRQYDFDALDTKKHVFSLLMVIFSNLEVFSSRFRYHTLIVVKECCLHLFSEKQQLKFPNLEQIAGNKVIDSWVYLHDDEQPVPKNLENLFIRRQCARSVHEKDTDRFKLSANSIIDISHPRKFSLTWHHSPFMHFLSLHFITKCHYFSNICYLLHLPKINYNHGNDTAYLNEAQSARSGRFNTLSKRPTTDKFKHRFRSKDIKNR
ncbi:unnamed protein product [Rotaria magnacalcarata]|uniref:Uncharacterized protein n=3 Tax=Rotaria magnacalcarata TaxID=392030 RepID=A0A816PA36_9BILA|nr:unnamed protein product [Rotaria magnacalcarata]CAF2045912.1 unnamed protein product [Rotaria magnacalcarata]CAF2140993.1 unnamed protein product [Rotaria magnacalcarata]CAF3812495.1 unnamed protein product [Rotaria magnacalcarata]